MSVKVDFIRGNTDLVDVKDGQLLFNIEQKRILMDAEVDGTMKRVDMTPSIEAIDDVHIDDQTLEDGEILVYNATSGKWENQALGSAATIDVPTGGDASASQVVMGNDSRLTDARNAADVYSWAKTAAKPTYTASEVGTYSSAEIDNLLSTVASGLTWKDTVATYSDIATQYPNPQDGWTVNVADTDYTYRYDGTKWIAISANAIPKATSSVDGLMTTEQVAKLNGISNKAAVSGGTEETLVTTGDKDMWNKKQNKSVVKSATLAVNGTTVTFDIPTSGNYIVDFATSTGINYNDIDVSTPGKVTLTFDPPSTSTVVYCEIKEV